MSAPQDPPRRNWQKRRRAKKLALWREKNAKAQTGADAKAEPAKAPAKAAPAKAAPAKGGKDAAAKPAAKAPAKK